jgi:hypothetical protein
MGDMYREILIKKERSTGTTVLKGALIALTVLCIAAGILLMPLFLLIGIVLAVLLYVLILPRMDIEYEYLYVNGELDIDVIYSRQKRKKAATYDMNELELLAPSNSHALDSYFQQKDTKIKDFTSGKADAKSYTLVMNQDKGREIVKVEIDDPIIADIRRMAPRKVNLI